MTKPMCAGRLAVLFTAAALVLFLPGRLWAQPAPPPEPEKTPEEKAEREGPPALREQYLASRRLKPGDPSFNAARARLEAVREMRPRGGIEDMVAPVSNPGKWQSIGPAPLNHGQTPTSVALPSDVSGRTTTVAVDPVDNSIYVGAAQGGVWKSLDNGGTWTPLTDGLASLAIGSIAIDPTPHVAGNATLYVGTGEGNYTCDNYGGIGVYKSVDSGATWTGPYGVAQFQNQSVGWLAVDRANPNHLFATTAVGVFGLGCSPGPVYPPLGIFESTNGGANWVHSAAGNNQASVVLQDPRVATTWWAAMFYTFGGYAGVNGGLLKSIDNGATWNHVDGVAAGLPAVNSAWGRGWVTATVDNPATPANSVLYFANGVGSGSLYKSVDSGASWVPLPAVNGYCAPQCNYDMPVYVEPGDPSRVYLGGSYPPGPGLPAMFMRSDDGGASFTAKVTSPGTGTALHPDMHFITTWPGQPNRLWVATDGGVWRSDDRGDTWINANTTLAITQFQACDLHPSDPGIAYAGSQDNGTEFWEGPNNWKVVDYSDGGFSLIDRANPSNLVHTYFSQTNYLISVMFTSNGFATVGGYNQSSAPSNGIALSDPVLFYAPIHLDRGAPHTLYYGTDRLWRATNFFVTGGTGNEFAAVNSGQDLAPAGGALSAIETVPSVTPGANADVILTGSSTGEIFRTTNATAATPTWTQVDLGASPLYVSDILADPSNPNVVYASRSGFRGAPGLNVRKSVDGGVNWAPAASGIPDVPVNALALDPVIPNKIWAGTDIGVFVSANGGTSWAPFNAGLPAVAVFNLKSNGVTKQILACTHGRSAYILSLDDDLIFRDGFETGNVSHWSTSSNSGAMSTSSASAMAGTTKGLQTAVSGTAPLFVQDDSPNGEGRFRARFYFNPNSFDTGEAQSHHRVRLLIGFNASSQRAFTIVLRRQVGQFAIEGRVRQNNGSRVDSGFVGLTSAPHFIEIDWVKATTGQANGTFTLYIDGTAQPATTGIADDTQTIESARLGALSVKGGALGTMYFDQYESRRVNYIGPIL